MSKTFTGKAFAKKHKFETEFDRKSLIRQERAESRRLRESRRTKQSREW